jgi:phosphotransferase system  glucose/maltose/N-acetylglucosamine-specific IIC component
MGLRFVIYAILIVLSMVLVYRFDIGYIIGFVFNGLLIDDLFVKYTKYTKKDRLLLSACIILIGYLWRIEPLFYIVLSIMIYFFIPKEIKEQQSQSKSLNNNPT